jgi:hypothetical protein
LAARWLEIDYLARRLTLKHHWVHPAAIDAGLDGWLLAICRELVIYGDVRPVDDDDAAAIAGLRIREWFRECRWTCDRARSVIFLFGNSDGVDWVTLVRGLTATH